jgi:hypothetical protein
MSHSQREDSLRGWGWEEERGGGEKMKVKEERDLLAERERDTQEHASRKRKRHQEGEGEGEGEGGERGGKRGSVEVVSDCFLSASFPGFAPLEEVLFYFLLRNVRCLKEREAHSGESLSADVMKAIGNVEKLVGDWEAHLLQHIVTWHTYALAPFLPSSPSSSSPSSSSQDVLRIRFVDNMEGAREEAVKSFQLWKKVTRLFRDWKEYLKRNHAWCGHSPFISFADQCMVSLSF